MMSHDDIGTLLAGLARQAQAPEPPPLAQDWAALEAIAHAQFSDAFKVFMELVVRYEFPGGLLYVARGGDVYGPDTMAVVYESEMELGGWDRDMIPFYALGNGDYYCLSASRGPCSGVYFVYHEDRRSEQVAASFTDWLTRAKELLGL